MRVLAVCGFGVGSSMVLKMTLEKAFKELGEEVTVENADMTTAKGDNADAIFTSKQLVDDFQNAKAPVYGVDSYTKKEEIKQVVQSFLNDKQ